MRKIFLILSMMFALHAVSVEAQTSSEDTLVTRWSFSLIPPRLKKVGKTQWRTMITMTDISMKTPSLP